MEPQTPVKRPKGFFRRNWIALILLASSISACFVHGIMLYRDEIGVVLMYGYLSLVRMSYPDTLLEFRLVSPKFGGEFDYFYTSGQEWGFIVPLWFLILLPTVWVAFREWRRARFIRYKH
jgi:hypothetical protein